MKLMLKNLCLLNGTSGDESNVRDFIINQIKDYCDYSIDNLGSIIAFKKGKYAPNKKVMLCAHMDEVGFIITNIDDDGSLSFDTVGGIDAKVVAGRSVIVNGIKGVIGLKPVHLLSDDEKKTAPNVKSMRIDIGAESKEDAQKFVHLGDYAYFDSDYTEFGDGYVIAKALDDRIGCMLLIELIKSELDYDTYFCFNVQEEVGLRGALCTSYQVQSDVSIVLEATTAADLCQVTGGDRVCILGNGGVVSFMDGRTIYDKELYNLAMNTAIENNIKVQTKTAVAGGNDAGAIQSSGKGSKVLAISLPCRYIHSGASVVKLSDIEETRKLIKTLLPKLYD
jgi:endoglucanase